MALLPPVGVWHCCLPYYRGGWHGTAASRRSLGRVSVPVWLIILSDQLKIVALVSLYLTNKLILRGFIKGR